MARLSLNIDQDSFDGAGFEPVPVGPYKVNIYSLEVTEVKNMGEHKGNPRLNFQFRIQDGETSPEGKRQGNRRLFVGVNAFKTKNKKTGKMQDSFDLIAIGKAIGLDIDQINNLDTDEWLGKELQLSVAAHESKMVKGPSGEYNVDTGEKREVIKSFRSVASAETAANAGAAVLAGAGAGAPASAAGNTKFVL